MGESGRKERQDGSFSTNVGSLGADGILGGRGIRLTRIHVYTDHHLVRWGATCDGCIADCLDYHERPRTACQAKRLPTNIRIIWHRVNIAPKKGMAVSRNSPFEGFAILCSTHKADRIQGKGPRATKKTHVARASSPNNAGLVMSVRPAR